MVTTKTNNKVVSLQIWCGKCHFGVLYWCCNVVQWKFEEILWVLWLT